MLQIKAGYPLLRVGLPMGLLKLRSLCVAQETKVANPARHHPVMSKCQQGNVLMLQQRSVHTSGSDIDPSSSGAGRRLPKRVPAPRPRCDTFLRTLSLVETCDRSQLI